MTTRVDKFSTLGERAVQQKSLQGECGGGVEKEVAHEFGGRIPHGGGDRDSNGIGIGWVVIVVLLFCGLLC